MSLNIDQIAEAFCRYRFGVTYPYMADEIKWNLNPIITLAMSAAQQSVYLTLGSLRQSHPVLHALSFF
jgi:hypothetical protein